MSLIQPHNVHILRLHNKKGKNGQQARILVFIPPTLYLNIPVSLHPSKSPGFLELSFKSGYLLLHVPVVLAQKFIALVWEYPALPDLHYLVSGSQI